ncbi:MAG: inositol monophosphatase family protein [Candidatus Aenigmarchaeota archaeon]|nr:inositol monophosphatase family protein [Candidatus Aenigmarchaeota archaeon]MDI6722435.1 inositol monophosphatase family protein [Candidatus Aenigmarchaeota archaeon]
MKELDVAIKAARESGKILNRYFRKSLKVDRKRDATPVTIADRESEKKIVSIIRKSFPDHNFLGSEFTWIIDPLDMTKNFVRGIPLFSNFITMEKDSKIIAVAYAMNIMAYAAVGKGTFVNGKKAKVSNIKDMSDAFVVFGDVHEEGTRPYTSQFFEVINKCYYNRSYGDGLGYILLAQGDVDIFLDRGKPWDVAAGKIIIEETGGRDTIYSSSIIATNRRLHEAVLNIFGKR